MSSKEVYKKVARPSIMYASKLWILSKRSKVGIQAGEMRILRKIEGKTICYTYKIDRIRNDDIRSQLGSKLITE